MPRNRNERKNAHTLAEGAQTASKTGRNGPLWLSGGTHGWAPLLMYGYGRPAAYNMSMVVVDARSVTNGANEKQYSKTRAGLAQRGLRKAIMAATGQLAAIMLVCSTSYHTSTTHTHTYTDTREHAHIHAFGTTTTNSYATSTTFNCRVVTTYFGWPPLLWFAQSYCERTKGAKLLSVSACVPLSTSGARNTLGGSRTADTTDNACLQDGFYSGK